MTSFIEADLKKQSQFAGSQIDGMLVITMAYGDLDDLRQRKNKAKQSQYYSSAFGVQSSAVKQRRGI